MNLALRRRLWILLTLHIWWGLCKSSTRLRKYQSKEVADLLKVYLRSGKLGRILMWMTTTYSCMRAWKSKTTSSFKIWYSWNRRCLCEIISWWRGALRVCLLIVKTITYNRHCLKIDQIYTLISKCRSKPNKHLLMSKRNPPWKASQSIMRQMVEHESFHRQSRFW